MLCAVDVQYSDTGTRAAALLFRAWPASEPVHEQIVDLPVAEPYVPGEFYKRELPAILAVIAGLTPTILIVDGFVWLEAGKPGLGAHLHQATGLPVVGVAKTAYRGADQVVAVKRGESQSPLWVSAVGLGVGTVAGAVAHMAGEFRVPTLLRRVDQLARGLVVPRPSYSHG